MVLEQLEQFRIGLSSELTSALLNGDGQKIISLKAMLQTFDIVFNQLQKERINEELVINR